MIFIADTKSSFRYIYGQSNAVDDSSSSVLPNSIKSYKVSDLFSDKQVSIANRSKHIILMNSWATWCIPCRQVFQALLLL
jgi:cytochrome c-type biogenesis protein